MCQETISNGLESSTRLIWNYFSNKRNAFCQTFGIIIMQQDFHKINVSTYLFYILFGGWWRVKRDTLFLSSLTCASYMLTFKFRHVNLIQLENFHCAKAYPIVFYFVFYVGDFKQESIYAKNLDALPFLAWIFIVNYPKLSHHII